MIDFRKETVILSETDRHLLNLLLSDKPKQADLDDILKNHLPTMQNKEILFLLLHFHKKHPSLIFPTSYSALFKEAGVLHRHSLLRLAAHFETIASRMAGSGIKPALIKGGAICSLMPGSPRFMADIDVLIEIKEFKRAVDIARQAGYTCSIDVHSADLHTAGSSDGVMDIHRFIPVTSGKGRLITGDILSRCSRTTFCSVDCLVPCTADLLFISVTNFSRNLLDRMRSTKIMMTMLDFKYLISVGIDWDIFVEDCIKTASQAEVAFTISIVNSIAPGMFPGRLENIPDEEEKRRFMDLFLFRRNVLVPLQNKRSGLRLWNAVREPGRIPQFLVFRPLYLFLKLFKYSPRIASTGIVRMITNRLPAHLL